MVNKPFQFEVVRSFSVGQRVFEKTQVFSAMARPFVKNRVEMLSLTFEDGLEAQICCEFVRFFEKEVAA